MCAGYARHRGESTTVEITAWTLGLRFTSMTQRQPIPLHLPAGPAGLDTLVTALGRAMDGIGPAVALLPAQGSMPPRRMQALTRAMGLDRPVTAGTCVVVATSGSSGDPIGVELSVDSLHAAAAGFADWWARDGGATGHRWVSLLPLHGVAGLMTAIRSLCCGADPIAGASLGGARSFTPEVFGQVTASARAASAMDGRPLAVSLVPTMLARLTGAAALTQLASYDLVLVGGAAAPADLMNRMRAADVRVVGSYGMTETCGGAVFNGWPIEGVTVGANAQGTLDLTGPVVATGYRDPALAHRFSGTWPARTFHSADRGHALPSGEVVVDGRIDDVVQVGGANIDLGAVADVAATVPGVCQSTAVAVPDQEWGSRVVLFVEVDERANVDLPSRIAADVADRLGRQSRPTKVIELKRLPLLPGGKVDRPALRRLALQRGMS